MKAKVHEIKQFRDREHMFSDRFEAGETLGKMLQPEYDRIEKGVVLAIPSGGVPVGIKVRDILGLPFDLVIVRKLQIPGNPEAGFGAMTLDGTVLYNQSLLTELRLSSQQIEAEKERVGKELEKRNNMFRQGHAFPDLAGKRVILVDDGLASGFTMLASVAMTKKAKALETIVAVPTAPERTVDRLLPKVNEIYCANVRSAVFFAVAEAYSHWYDLSEKEVVALLQSTPNTY
jgi:putative phosphoribosyl transferase